MEGLVLNKCLCCGTEFKIEEEPDLAPKNNIKEGKPAASLLPLDVLVEHIVPAYEEGVLKYKRESWRKGFKVSTMMDAALRHIVSYYHKGESIDPDSATNKHHLAGAVFCILSILNTIDRPELDDRPVKGGQP